MPEPLATYLSSSWLVPLWKKLRAIRGERDREIQKLGTEFVDPKLLARYYVEPNCQQLNPASRFEDRDPRSEVQSAVFKTINAFLREEHAVPRAGRHQMFVLSDAGMGKTSLLVMLKLAEMLRFWPSDQHCELLKLGADTIERVKAVPDPARTILLLDALDEDRTAWGRIEERLLELLAATEHFRRVILSCRTQFFPETSPDPFKNPGRIEIGGYVCPMIFLSLFEPEQVEEYLRKRFPDSWLPWSGAESKRAEARAMVEKMRDLRCRPMLLAHVEDLLGSGLRNWTEYGVYGALVKAWLDREERRLRRSGGGEVSSESLLAGCHVVAGHLQRNGVRVLSEAELQEVIGRHAPQSRLTDINFGGRSLLNRTSEGHYRFSHFSIQEYLVARWLIEEAANAERIEVPGFATEKVIRFVLDGRAELCPSKPLVLRGLNLARFDLEGMDLRGCDFSGATLAGANLESARLDGARLDGADLTGANLAGVRLTQPIEGLPFRQMLGSDTGIDMVWIAPGTFRREGGSRVRLSRGFWLGRFPVTQEQYQAVTGENPAHFKRSGSQAPVEGVNWEEAAEFCQRLTTRLTPPGSDESLEYGLPTEAQWEYACRAGSETEYCYGNEASELGA